MSKSRSDERAGKVMITTKTAKVITPPRIVITTKTAKVVPRYVDAAGQPLPPPKEWPWRTCDDRTLRQELERLPAAEQAKAIEMIRDLPPRERLIVVRALAAPPVSAEEVAAIVDDTAEP